MSPFAPRKQALVAFLLAAQMLVTRFHHFSSALRLPDARRALSGV